MSDFKLNSECFSQSLYRMKFHFDLSQIFMNIFWKKKNIFKHICSHAPLYQPPLFVFEIDIKICIFSWYVCGIISQMELQSLALEYKHTE